VDSSDDLETIRCVRENEGFVVFVDAHRCCHFEVTATDLFLVIFWEKFIPS
jgi:hypothetical protein